MKNRLIILLLVLLPSLSLAGQAINKETRLYAIKDHQELRMDIYQLSGEVEDPQPCLIFLFGGGFKGGERDAPHYTSYFQHFASKGFTVASIDYRLGMKDQKAPGVFNTKPLQNAIGIAVEDLYKATAYLVDHAHELKIDPSLFIISGSSAGAITVLQADYELQNRLPSAGILPEKFRYAGVISFAGAIFSTEGVPSYEQRPAPTLFFHGSADKLVPYNKFRFFRIGMFGSKTLTKVFRESKFPYLFYSMEDIGHEVSEYPMTEFLPEIQKFIQDYIFEQRQWMTDIRFKDMLRMSDKSSTPGNYYE